MSVWHLKKWKFDQGMTWFIFIESWIAMVFEGTAGLETGYGKNVEEERTKQASIIQVSVSTVQRCPKAGIAVDQSSQVWRSVGGSQRATWIDVSHELE